MKNIIPYEKDIKFDTKIAEITSISLEHEESFNDDDLEGNFIVSGDYKVHQISVNKEQFNYKIPFTIELSDNIDKSSVEIDINDFTYDIKDNDTLLVKIDLLFSYEELKLKEERLDEIKEERLTQEELDKEIDELINNEKEEKKEIIEETKEAKIIEETPSENTYVTYHVYIVNKDDTLDTICLKYNVDKDILHEYNEFEELKVGDKILIPIKDE